MPFSEHRDRPRIFYDRVDPEGGPGSRALIFLNHLSTNRLMWRPVMAAAAREGWTSLAVDARGCGRSDVPWGVWTTADLAADAVAVLDHAGVEVADVCGISLGGCVAQELALGYPDRVGSLILMGTTSNGRRPGNMSNRELLKITWAQLRTGAPRDKATRRLMRVLTSNEFAQAAEATPAWALAQRVLTEKSPRRGTLQQLVAGTLHSTTRRLEHIEAPTAVIHGTADRLFPVRAAERMAARIPGARFVPLDGLGHGMVFQAPEQCTREILQFVGAAREQSPVAAPAA